MCGILGKSGHVEDIHLILGHIITSYFVCNDKNPKSESFIDE
jgi:hypothetical protein